MLVMSTSDDELEYLLRLRDRMAAALEESNGRIDHLRRSISVLEEKQSAKEAAARAFVQEEQEEEDQEESSSGVDA